MDKTAVFKAYVKTIRTRNRAFGSVHQQQTADVLRQRKPPRRDDFSRRAKDVVNDLAKLADFLDRHYNDYMDVRPLDQHTTMTDADRDKIDVGAQHIIKTSGQQVPGSSVPPFGLLGRNVCDLPGGARESVCNRNDDGPTVTTRMCTARERF